MTIVKIVALYGLVSLLGYFLIQGDKHAARQNKIRVEEKSLVYLGLLCGWPGIFIGMQYYRHKIYKTQFKLQMKVAAIANVAGVWAILKFSS